MTDKELIKSLRACAEWFSEHGRNTNTAVIDICKAAADRLEQLQQPKVLSSFDTEKVFEQIIDSYSS